MSSLEVNPQALGEIANGLYSMGPTMQKMQSTGDIAAGSLGGNDIESAVTGFSHTWNYGAGQLAKHVENLAENLGKAAQAYAKAEQHIIDGAQTTKT
jgi:uncharacterized protein YukE